MSQYLWTVIGAGPAGICAIGQLLDEGEDPKDIMWIDPYFQVGDFLKLWQKVPSNTKVKLFTAFLNGFKSFKFDNANQSDFELCNINPEKGCKLKLMGDALQWVSDHLKETVNSKKTKSKKIQKDFNYWKIICDDKTQIVSKNIILATGSTPKTLPYPELFTIPLEKSMDKESLKDHLNENDSVALFGSSHSAILALRALLENDVRIKKIINFYKSPVRYAVDMGDWILFDNTGLKGEAATWAKENLNAQHPNLTRVISNPENLEQHLPLCNKAIYAVGFERHIQPVIEGIGLVSYNDKTGIIAPGLYGFGIAYPQTVIDRMNNVESSVGLYKFMVYLKKVMPIWLKYNN